MTLTNRLFAMCKILNFCNAHVANFVSVNTTTADHFIKETLACKAEQCFYVSLFKQKKIFNMQINFSAEQKVEKIRYNCQCSIN